MSALGPERPSAAAEPALTVGEVRAGAVSSVLWSGVAFGGNRFIVFASTLALARMLVPEDFGIVAAAMVLVSLFEIGLDLGFGAALVYEQEEGISARVQTAFTVNLLACAALTAAGMLAAPWIAAFFQVPDQTAIFRVVFLYLLVRGSGQIHDAILKRDLDFRRRTVADIGRAVVRAGVAVPLAALGAGPWSLIVGLLAGEACGTILNWLLVRFRPTLRIDRTALRTLVGYGSAIVVFKIVGWVTTNADYVVIGRILGPDPLGIYTIGYRLPELVIANVLWIFSSVAFPVYSRARRGGGETFRSTMLKALRLTTLFALPAATGLAIASHHTVLVLFGERWEAAALPMALLALATGVQSLGFASGDIFPAIGRPWLMPAIAAPCAALLVVGYVLVADRGIVAIAAAQLVFQLLYGFLRVVIAGRLVRAGVRSHLAAMWPSVCVSLGILVVALPVSMLTPLTLLGLVATLLAGVVGALLAIAVGARGVVGELRDLLGEVRRSAPATAGEGGRQP